MRPQLLRVRMDLILPDVPAEAVDLDDAGHCPQARLHLPVEDRAPLHQGVPIAFDEHVVDLAQPRADRGELRGIHARRKLLLRLP